jgi:uncharacterized membrane protein YkgB
VLIFAAVLAIFVYGMIAVMLGTIAFSQALGLIIASVGVGPLLDNQDDTIGLILGLAFIVVALFARSFVKLGICC